MSWLVAMPVLVLVQGGRGAALELGGLGCWRK